MAGSITVTKDRADRSVQKVSLAWVSDASGDVNGTTIPLMGTIQRITYVPNGGATAPTALYDVVMNDAESVDVLDGTGANLSATATSTAYPLLGAGNNVPAIVSGLCTLVVTNAGSAKGGTVHLYLSK